MLFGLKMFSLMCFVNSQGVSGDKVQVVNVDMFTCFNRLYYLDEFKTIRVEWDGRTLPFICRLSFIGISRNLLKKYQICVEALKYDIYECKFSLKYFKGTIISAKEYSCNDDLPSKFCASLGNAINITFKATAAPKSSLALEITVMESYLHTNGTTFNATAMVYVGVGIAVTVSTTLVCVAQLVVYMRRKNQNIGVTIAKPDLPVIQSPKLLAELDKPNVRTGLKATPQATDILQHLSPVPPITLSGILHRRSETLY